MIRVERAPMAANLSIDYRRMTLQGVFQGLYNQEGAPLAEHEAVARPIEWARRRFRRIIARGCAFNCIKGGDIHRADPRLGSARDRHIDLALANPLKGVG